MACINDALTCKKHRKSEASGLKNYYVILEVSRNATRDEIKQAFLDRICFVRLDRFEKGSPDWENAAKLLDDVNEAYACLGDEKRREEYDKELERETAAQDERSKALMKRLAVASLVAVLFLAGAFRLYFSGNDGDNVARAEPQQREIVRPASSEIGGRAGFTVLPVVVSRDRGGGSASPQAFKYIRVWRDESAEILLEADSTIVYDGDRYASIWMKHVPGNGGAKTLSVSLDIPMANTSNIGHFIVQNLCDFENNVMALLEISYYDRNGRKIGGSRVPDDRILWTLAEPKTSEGLTLAWLEKAVRATRNVAGTRGRALRIGGAVQLYRAKELEAEFARTVKDVEDYSVKKGGTILAPTVRCRTAPHPEAPIDKDMLKKGTPVFVTKRYRDTGGDVWYYVEHISAKGWIPERSVKVY